MPPLRTLVATRAQITELNAAWAHVQGWVDPAWQCSTTAPLLPDVGWVRSLVGDPGNAVMVCRDGTAGVGAAVYRLSDARILWLICHPARFAEVAAVLIPAVSTHAGFRAWGAMSAPGPRQALLDAGVVVPRTDKPQYGETAVQAA